MEFSTLGAHTPTAWETWHANNVDVTDAGVTVAREDVPTYVSPELLLEASADIDRWDPPEEDCENYLRDVAVDGCGNYYLLTAEGDVYRHESNGEGPTRLGCLWREGDDPRALAVTSDTIFVAGGDPAQVQAYSREVNQTRWILDAVVDPVAVARVGDAVYLLDRGDRRGRGVVRRIGRHDHAETVVTGLFEPVDVAADDEGSLYVLDRQAREAPGAAEGHVVRRFDADALGTPPVPAAGTIWIPPAGFEVGATGEPVVPACIAVGEADELVAGVDPDWDGQKTLLRYRPGEATFERQTSFTRGCSRLVIPRSGPRRLLALDGDDRLVGLDAVHATIRNEEGALDGHLLTRLDAGEVDTQWHRVELDFDLDGPGTQVRLRYRATDDDHPGLPAVDSDAESPDLEVVDGIGPRYARRLRRAGITGLADLAACEAETVATILSVEEGTLSTARAADWLSQAETLLADSTGEPPGIRAIDGLGPAYAARLRDAGVVDLEDLLALDAAGIVTVVGSQIIDVSTERARALVEAARAKLPDPPDFEEPDWKTAARPNPRDALLDDAVGRYLWVRLDLVGAEYDAPLVRSFDASLPRQSYLQDLPAIYRSDPEASEFLERFLALFEGVFTDVEASIEDLTRYMDPQGMPAGPGHLEWLGSWLATEMDDAWPEAAKREFVARAPDLFRMRGTRKGLLATIRLFLEHVDVSRRSWDRALERERERLDALVAAGYLTPEEAADARDRHEALAASDDGPLVRVVEHADLDCLADGPAREPYTRLISCPQGFLVLLHPALADEHVRAIGRIVEAQRPAHASGRSVALRPHTVLTGASDSSDRGFHTYLGINTELSERDFELDESVLGQETVLAEREPYGQLGVQSRLGEDAHVS
jgi:phage tail-like protein